MKPSSVTAGKTIITTHTNTDFDGLASMLAAKKRYPEAQIVLPGARNRNLQHFFIQSVAYLFDMKDAHEIDMDQIQKLIVVDTRNPERIGPFKAVLQNRDVFIEIYDHHPAKDGDIAADRLVYDNTGANTTILTEIIIERQIEITPDEATILCLGIYEDTGSFGFKSTTARDLAAAAFLVGKGANIEIISTLLTREISSEQVGLLNDLLHSVTYHQIGGIEIAVSSVTSHHYIPDFSFLVHRLATIKGLKVVFAISRMEDKVFVVGRSQREEANVGKILGQMGGGGHACAAATAIKGKTLPQIEEQLLTILRENIRPLQTARRIMSSPAIWAPENTTCKAAGEQMTRYSINALVVTKDPAAPRNISGFITRQIIERALHHQLGHVPIREYMRTHPATVSPEAPLTEIQTKIIDHKQRLLPVISDGLITGVITRSDLLDMLVSEKRRSRERAVDRIDALSPRTRDITRFLKERLSEDHLNLLAELGQTAARMGFAAYVVGGFVRDLFLAHSNEDVDIVIEGDGIAFARELARQTGARTHTHARFGTAVITFSDGFKLDVASARTEYYRFPADLPIVEMSSIKLDLFRRDFTINAMAVCLNPRCFGTLIDYFSSRRDIKQRAIRVLHNLSFVEDPTRVFRAIRFEQRFGFQMGKLTSGLIENAVKMDFFKKLEGRRIFSELKHIMAEKSPLAALQRLEMFGLLKVIHPRLKLNKATTAAIEAVKETIVWYDLLFIGDFTKKWTVYFLALLHRFDAGTSRAICERLELDADLSRLLTENRMAAEKALIGLGRQGVVTNSDFFDIFSGMETALVLYLFSIVPETAHKKRISRFLTHDRFIEVEINGDDLKELGIAPGPIYRRIFKRLHRDRLDEKISTRAEELAIARTYAATNNNPNRRKPPEP